MRTKNQTARLISSPAGADNHMFIQAGWVSDSDDVWVFSSERCVEVTAQTEAGRNVLVHPTVRNVEGTRRRKVETFLADTDFVSFTSHGRSGTISLGSSECAYLLHCSLYCAYCTVTKTHEDLGQSDIRRISRDRLKFGNCAAF
jgi:hypothetical protein